MRRRSSQARRGVLLLVVLGLLAMFAMVAVAFVVLTGHERRGAEVAQRVEQVVDPPDRLLDQAFSVVARGTALPSNWTSTPPPAPPSAIMSCSLLEKIYGNNYLGPFPSAGCAVTAGGQLLSLPCGSLAPVDVLRRIGSVVTFIDGTAVGMSCRIVGFDPTNFAFHMLPADGMKIAGGRVTINGQVLSGRFIINGMPYSGQGYGYNASTGVLSQANANGPVAFQPNARENWNPTGGANSDYTAPDHQDPLLAFQMPSGGAIRTPLPSLHRPELVQYWAKTKGNGNWRSLPPALLRSILFRPNLNDHPLFNKFVNPTFDPTWDGITNNGLAWDVDNDGDGVPDSVWVDLGLPVRWTPDGRPYKPLFAILCLDMDGRLNVNAHGVWAHTLGNAAAVTNDPPAALGYQLAGGGAPTPGSLPRGQGYGPAEVNLGNLLTAGYCQQLFRGNGTVSGRYGSKMYPGLAAGETRPSWNQWFEYNRNYWGFLTAPATYKFDAYRSPPDLDGYGAVGLDLAGRPLYLSMGQATANNPYQLDLTRSARHGFSDVSQQDDPFGPAELERIVRRFDRDASKLPDRLSKLLPPTDATLRCKLTSESWSVPVASSAVPESNRRFLGARPQHPVDLMIACLRRQGITDPNRQAQWIMDLLPMEVICGLKMNVNRPLGAIGNIPVTTAGTATNESMQQYVNATGGVANVPVSYYPTGGNRTQNDALTARQNYAKQLYVLAMLLVDTSWLNSHVTPGGPEAAARYLAQWAVNVVSFRDNHAVMIPFHFDPTPFRYDPTTHPNPWCPPKDTSGQPDPKYVVFGCKRPELLITETLAFHDRRTEDLNTERFDLTELGNGPATKAGKTTDTDPKAKDQSFDQRYRPQGSLFIELFNPWTALEPPHPSIPELDVRDSAGRIGVNLAKLSRGTAGSPVWRLIIVNGTQATLDPDDPNIGSRPAIERSIYFVNPTSGGITGDGTRYYPSSTAFAPLIRGRYAVVGPKGTTYIGKGTGASTLFRQIVLTANTNPDVVDQVKVLNNKAKGGLTANELPNTSIQPPIAVPIDAPRRPSISEPTAGYTTQGYNAGSDSYNPPIDKPLDQDPTLTNTGTTPGYKIVYLQRLANPTQDFNTIMNPYRTIDGMPIDLTAFNGITSATDPQDVKKSVMLHTRERGDKNDTANANDLWADEPITKTIVADAKDPGSNSDFFPYKLTHSLGYLNQPFGVPYPTAGPHRGDPTPGNKGPFPWLTFNNRPFVSALELLLVPAVSSSQLLKAYAIKAAGNPYAPANPAQTANPHLMDFFMSTAATPAATSPQFHRILDYVTVPSRFVGSAIQANPNTVRTGNHLFYPPFNRIPTYREPGLININTIPSVEVFQGLMNSFPGMATAAMWDKVARSRQGYNQAVMTFYSDPANPNNSLPTRFAKPFRSFAGGMLVPMASLMPTKEVDATLLRSEIATPTRPLFQYDSANIVTNSTRSPYFRHEALQRLGNLVTTRSNVFAVWITVGYFEAIPVTVNADHPDGFALGAERGSDTGEIERHRAFYLFDRSIPVGFMRGENLNYDKALLIRRFIE